MLPEFDFTERILITDDEPSVRYMVQALLHECGYHVDIAANGLEALKKMEHQHFDMLITDIIMPNMDGLTLIKEAMKQHHDIISIVMTGFATLETAKAAMSSGAYNYIIKPFDSFQLIDAVKKAFDRRRLIIENIKLKELTGLFRISQDISATIDWQELLRLVLEAAVSQTKSTSGAIIITDENTCEPIYVFKLGNYKKEYEVSSQLLKNVAMEGNLFIITWDKNNTICRLSFNNYLEKRHELSAKDYSYKVLIFPLKLKNKIIGIIVINNENPFFFSELDIQILSILSSYAVIAMENSKLFTSLQENHFNTIRSLVITLEAKDPYTRGHSDRVAKLCSKVGKRLNLNSDELEKLQDSAMLHDIGKIGISESILNKPGPLTKEEYNIIKMHPVIGSEIIQPVKFLSEINFIIRHHHERVDGKGYPDNLADGQIDILTKILGVIDAFDAMNSWRAYRKKLPLGEIVDVLASNKCSQFDPIVVDKVLDLIETKEIYN